MNNPILKIYKPFASSTTTCIFGHLLAKSPKHRNKPTKNPFKNALEMYRRYQVSPLKRQTVTLTLETGEIHELKTDKKGYFQFVIDTPSEVEAFSFQVSYRDEMVEHEQVTVLDPEIIVVSDVDDTILVSHATKLLKKLYLLLTKNAESRKTFRDISVLYQEMTLGLKSKYFYVSSSEWNLYDFLQDFISFQELPEGYFLLQDIKSGLRDLFKSGGGSHSHKKDKIELLLSVYPGVPFILVGDSGQKDPDIYLNVVKNYPDRIQQVYIRDVRKSRRVKLKKLKQDLIPFNTPLSVIEK